MAQGVGWSEALPRVAWEVVLWDDARRVHTRRNEGAA